VHADFQIKAKPEITSTSKPQMKWMPPGSLGDMVGNRQYTFLMYKQPSTFIAKGLPPSGQMVNMQDFTEQNGLQKAVAGQTMVINKQNAAQLGMGIASSMSGMPTMPSNGAGIGMGMGMDMASSSGMILMTGGMQMPTAGAPNSKVAVNAASNLHGRVCGAAVASAVMAL
jgi:hypothetical protein